MKNLLVTGGCGFIGSNFINYFYDRHPDVHIINIDAMYYCARKENVREDIRNSDRYTLVVGNLCSLDLVNHILTTYHIDTVIHFAAQSHVQNSFNDSLTYTMDNIVATHTLLECCHRYKKIDKFIHISTDEVYGESLFTDETKKNEQSLLCPSNAYSSSKASCEMLCHAYQCSFKFPIIITRSNNIYGPNQYKEKLIPLFIDLLQNNKKVTIQGDGSNLRSFLHVSDVVTAFEIILEHGKIGEIYNIGAEKEYSVLEVSKLLIGLIKETNNYDNWIEYIEDRPFNDKRYFISNDKIKSLGWEIKKEFIEGIQELLR